MNPAKTATIITATSQPWLCSAISCHYPRRGASRMRWSQLRSL